EHAVDVCGSWRDECRDQSTLASVRRHCSPRHPVVLTSGHPVAVGEVPVGVELVVFAIANRFITRHRYRVARKLLYVHPEPVFVTSHRGIRMLKKGNTDMKTGPLVNDIIPDFRSTP